MSWICEVVSINGEYAMLRRTDMPDQEPYMVALFLLPDGVDAGTRLRCENLIYSIEE